MSKPRELLLVGTGRMAETHARRFNEIDGVNVLAAVDVSKERVDNFCSEHGISHAYTSLDDALASHRFDACSVVTPDAFHASASIECLAAGLPVLCEKPLSDSLANADAMIAAAASSAQNTMVNLSYRTSGALNEARKLIDQGELGEIRHVEASYRQSWLVSDYWGDWQSEDAWLWRLSTAHGSLGVLGDIGIHILDFLCAGTGQSIAGLQCRLQTFDKAPGNRMGDYQLDANDSCVMNVELANGAVGVVHMSRYYTGYMNDLSLTIHGTLGALKVSTGQNGDKLMSCVGKRMHSQTWTEVLCKDQPDTFDRFVDMLKTGKAGSPDFAHAGQLQRYLELAFNSHDKGCWLTPEELSA